MEGGGGVEPNHLSLRIIFPAKTGKFLVSLRVWFRGDQALRHPCKLRNLAISILPCKKNHKNLLFLLFYFISLKAYILPDEMIRNLTPILKPYLATYVFF